MSDWRSLRFGRSASSYHDATPVQRWMAHRLIEWIGPRPAPKLILELGCGTGHLTRALAEAYPTSTIVATDLSPAMLREAATQWPRNRTTPRWQHLDARAPLHAICQPDLVASNAVVQWFPDLEEHFRAIHKLGEGPRQYALTGFCRDHFPELEPLLRHEFGYAPGPGHELEEAAAAAERAGWRVVQRHQESRIETYPSAAEFLRHLKASGANRPPPDGHPLTRSRLQRLLERLSQVAATPTGVAITWKPWFLVLESDEPNSASGSHFDDAQSPKIVS